MTTKVDFYASIGTPLIFNKKCWLTVEVIENAPQDMNNRSTLLFISAYDRLVRMSSQKEYQLAPFEC